MDRLEVERILNRPTASQAEAAAILGFSERSFRQAVKKDAIPSIAMSDKPKAKRNIPTSWIAKKVGIEPNGRPTNEPQPVAQDEPAEGATPEMEQS
jgi:hypothetical protein